jgi:hypothetical protein
VGRRWRAYSQLFEVNGQGSHRGWFDEGATRRHRGSLVYARKSGPHQRADSGMSAGTTTAKTGCLEVDRSELFAICKAVIKPAIARTRRYRDALMSVRFGPERTEASFFDIACNDLACAHVPAGPFFSHYLVEKLKFRYRRSVTHTCEVCRCATSRMLTDPQASHLGPSAALSRRY